MVNELKYYRSGGHRRPQDLEQLQINLDGTFTLWRSVSWTTNPATPVGYFGGQLDKPENERLQQEAAQAALEGGFEAPLNSDIVQESISLDEVEATMGLDFEPEGSWQPLVIRLRGLLTSLTSYPVSAVGLEVAPDWQSASLYHLGSEPLELNLEKLKTRWVIWDGFDKAGDWEKRSGNSRPGSRVKAGPGWSLKLPFGQPVEAKPGQELAVYASFEIIDEGFPIEVELYTKQQSLSEHRSKP